MKLLPPVYDTFSLRCGVGKCGKYKSSSPVRCHKKASGTGYIAIEACSTTMLLPPKLWQPTSTQPKNRQQCHKAYNKTCARARF
mmetsp:Transcript_16331/g.18808  ORF Transcript_16331/g.18808 Transcript_16331/m.18808 type:complete len:84 (-) Transcript_16331:757-1008(-)